MRTLILLTLLVPIPLGAQGTKLDYERAAGIRKLYDGKVLNATIKPIWFEDDTFHYSAQRPEGGSEHIIIDAAKGTRRAVKVDELPKAAPPAPRRAREPALASNAKSPNGLWEVFYREENVWLRELATKAEEPFSSEGTEPQPYRGEVYWSPDSSAFVAFRHRSGATRQVTLVESSPRDQVQPRLKSYSYLKPGDAIEQVHPQVFRIVGSLKLSSADARLDVKGRADNSLFHNSWAIDRFHWSADSKRFMFLYNQRGHQVMRLITLEAKTGKATAIINEECKTFFDYSNKTYLRYLQDGNLLWMSERSGWNQLYRIDAKTGDLKNAVTAGEWVVRSIERVDEETQQIWLRVMGRPGQSDPYFVHLARVNFDGTGFIWLTDGDGTHDWQWSPTRKYYIDTFSKLDAAPVHVLFSAEGKKILDLETADVSAIQAAGWKPPETFALPGRDGKTLMYGYIVRPSNFDPKKQYPVLEHIYAGPHDFFVQKRFAPTVYESAMAELGFIIIRMDGMGTNWRSRAFHDVAWKNLVDSGFPDRIAVIKALAAKHPEMDIAKGVGIYGGSAGGQSALAGLLHHGDFYTVAVADCGCHDNRMDKIWWNEAWMGTVGPHYAEQSNVTNAHKLKGKLLLIVGEVDNNVDPASTMQVANALIKADKDFELLVMPGVGHGAAETPYGQRRRQDFFVRNLLGVEPRR